MNPEHIAIIMDGNGRWAKQRGLSRIEGHKEGINRVREIIEASIEMNVKALTLYVFSMENWKRPLREINALMALLESYMKKEMRRIHEKNVQFRAIGDIERFPPIIRKLVQQFEEMTQNNTGLILVCAMSYSGRYEIVNAVKSIMQSGLDPNAIDESAINQHLYTQGIPDPDLIIRTSGEMRLSNFLLWQAAYAEFYFTNVYWPDFGKEQLIAAIKDFRGRERRFGAVQKGFN
jgi:undecaprenyl diphosphate synthase